MIRGGISFFNRNKIKPDELVVNSLRGIHDMRKFPCGLSFNLNALKPFVTPPQSDQGKVQVGAAKHRDNVYYIISEQKHLMLIEILKNHVKSDNLVTLTTQVLQNIVGIDKFREQNMANILLETETVENCQLALQQSIREQGTIAEILYLYQLLFANNICNMKIVKKGIMKEVIDNMNRHRGNKRIQKLGMNIAKEASSIKQNCKQLIEQNLLDKMLEQVNDNDEEQDTLQLQILNNFSKSEEGKKILEDGQKGINKAMDLMLANQNNEKILDNITSLLENISNESDVQKSIDNIKRVKQDKGEGDVHKDMALLSMLTLVPEFQKQIKKNKIHGLMLDNIKEQHQNRQNKKPGDKDDNSQNEMVFSSMILSRILDDEIVDDVIKTDGLNVMQQALSNNNTAQQNQSLFQFYQEITKHEQDKVIKSGAIDKMMDILNSNINDKKLINQFNSILQNIHNNKDIEGRLEILIKVINSNPEDKDIVNNCLENIQELIYHDIDNDKYDQIVPVIQTIGLDNCEKWKKNSYQFIKTFNKLLDKEKDQKLLKKIKGNQKEQSKYSKMVFSLLKNKKLAEMDESKRRKSGGMKNFFAQKKQKEKKQLDNDGLSKKEQEDKQQQVNEIIFKIYGQEDVDKNINGDMKKSIQNYMMNNNDDKANNELECQLELASILYKDKGYLNSLNEQKQIDQIIDLGRKILNNKNNNHIQLGINKALLSNIMNGSGKQKDRNNDYVGLLNDVIQQNRMNDGEMMELLDGCARFLEHGFEQGTYNKEDYKTKGKNQIDRLIESMVMVNKKQYDKEVQMQAIKILDMLIENDKQEVQDNNILGDLNAVGGQSSQSNLNTVEKIIKEGGIRMCINKLQDINTPVELGTKVIEMLKKIPVSKIMNVNEVYQSTMQFISNQNNNQQVQSVAQSLLQDLIRQNQENIKNMGNKNNQTYVDTSQLDQNDLTVIDIDKQINDFIEQARKQSVGNLQEQIQIFNQLNNIQLLQDYNGQLIDKNIIQIYLETLNQQLGLDEDQLCATGQINEYNQNVGLVLQNVKQLMNESEDVDYKNINQQLGENGIEDILSECIVKKNHTPNILQNALELTNMVLNNSKIETDMKKKILDKLVEEGVGELLVEIQENNSDGEILKQSQELLFKLIDHDPDCIKKEQQEQIVKEIVKQIKNDNYMGGYSILNSLYQGDVGMMDVQNVQAVMVKSIKDNQQINKDQIELLQKMNGQQINKELFKEMIQNMDYDNSKQIMDIIGEQMKRDEVQEWLVKDGKMEEQLWNIVKNDKNGDGLLEKMMNENRMMEQIRKIGQKGGDQAKEMGLLQRMMDTQYGQNMDVSTIQNITNDIIEGIQKQDDRKLLVQQMELVNKLNQGSDVFQDLDKEQQCNILEKVREMDGMKKNKVITDMVLNMVKDNNQLTPQQLQYMNEQVYDTADDELKLLKVMVNNQMENTQAVNRLSNLIKKSDGEVDQVKDIIKQMVEKENIPEGMLQQMGDNDNIMKVICGDIGDKEGLQLMEKLLDNGSNKDQVNKQEIIKKLIDEVGKQNVGEQKEKLLDSYDSLDRLMDNGVFQQQGLDNGLIEQMENSMKLKDKDIRDKVDGLMDKLIQNGDNIDQVVQLMKSDGYTVEQPKHIEQIYTVVQSKELDKEVLQQMMKQIEGMDDKDKEGLQDKIDLIKQLSEGNNLQQIQEKQRLINEINNDIFDDLDGIMRILREYKDNKEVLMKVLNKVKGNEELKQQLQQKGLNGVLMRMVMDRESDILEEQKVGSKIMRELMGLDVHVVELKSDWQSVKNVDKVVDSHDDRGIVNDQLEVIDILTDDPNILNTNMDGLLQTVMKQIEKGNHDDVVYNILKKLMGDDKFKEQIYKEDKVYREIEKQDVFSDGQLDVLQQLSKMRQSDKNNKNKYDDMNVLDKLEKQLEQQIGQEENQERLKNILQAEANIIYNNKENSGYLIKKEGQQSRMMDLMDKVKDKNVMDAVSNLGSSLAFKNKENKETMMKNGLISHIKQMIDNNKSDLNGCQYKLIANNSQSVQSVKQITSLGVLDVLMDKMDDENMNIILDTTNNCSGVKDCTFDKKKVVGKMIEVLEDKQLNGVVVGKALSICENMLKVDNRKVGEVMVEQGILETLQSVLKAQDNNEPIISQALKIIRQLSRQKDNVQKMIDCSMDADVINILDLYPYKETTVKNGLDIIKNMAIDKKKCFQIHENGFVKAVSNIINSNQYDQADQVVNVMNQMVGNNENVAEEICQNVGQQILQQLDNYNKINRNMDDWIEFTKKMQYASTTNCQHLLACGLLDSMHNVLSNPHYQDKEMTVLPIVNMIDELVNGNLDSEILQIIFQKEIVGDLEDIKDKEGQKSVIQIECQQVLELFQKPRKASIVETNKRVSLGKIKASILLSQQLQEEIKKIQEQQQKVEREQAIKQAELNKIKEEIEEEEEEMEQNQQAQEQKLHENKLKELEKEKVQIDEYNRIKEEKEQEKEAKRLEKQQIKEQQKKEKEQQQQQEQSQSESDDDSIDSIEDMKPKKDVEFDIPIHVKNFLTAGKLFKVYKQNGSRKEMHVFCTPDLKEIIAKRPKRQTIKNNWRIQLQSIQEIVDFTEKEEFVKSSFYKHKGIFKKVPDMNLCLVIFGATTLQGSQIMNIQAENERDKNKLIQCLNIVLNCQQKQKLRRQNLI